MINAEQKQQFKSDCEQHDWLYEYSDDFQRYNEGEKIQRKLLATVGNNSELKNIYNKHNPFYDTLATKK